MLLAPHLDNHGANNTAWVGDWNGVTMLFAQCEGYALALACSTPFARCSVGFVGTSAGWQDLRRHKEMQWTYTRAENGNVALTAEIDLQATQGEFRLALGFGSTPDEAAQWARSSLLDNFADLRDQYIQAWQSWQQTLLALDEGFSKGDLYRTSTAVLRTHESKTFPGGFIASLSIPWGFAQGDGDLGGYHLVWVRDLVETAGGLLAAGAHGDMNRVLRYLRVTQHPAGNWPQNMWIDGTAYCHSEQLDETALPLLLLAVAYRETARPPVQSDAAAHRAVGGVTTVPCTATRRRICRGFRTFGQKCGEASDRSSPALLWTHYNWTLATCRRERFSPKFAPLKGDFRPENGRSAPLSGAK